MWINWKRRVKRDLLVQEDKNTWKIEAEKQQKNLNWIGRGEKVRKSLKRLLKKWWTCAKKLFYKTQISNFDRSKIRFERSSINRVLIELGRFKPKFLSHFQSVKRQIQSIKNLKTQIFEKQSILMQKLLKAYCFINKMHEYEIKSFSKIVEFNPDLPKTSFSTNLSSKLKH